MATVMLYGKHTANETALKSWKPRRQKYFKILRKGAKYFPFQSCLASLSLYKWMKYCLAWLRMLKQSFMTSVSWHLFNQDYQDHSS